MIPYEKWMKDTYSVTKPRSTELKKLDEAIKNFQPANIRSQKALDDAFYAWLKMQGQNWRSSVRNRTGIVEQLYKLLNHAPKPLDPAELQAMRIVERANRENLERMFRGRTLTQKSTRLGKINDVRSVRNELNDLKKNVAPVVGADKAMSNISATHGIKAELGRLLSALFRDLPAVEVTQTLGSLYGEIIADLTPFVGVLKSGKDAVVGWIKTARMAWARYTADEARGSFAPGDPEKAFEAVLLLMERARNAAARSASTATASFTAHTILMSTGVGAAATPIVSAATAVANLLNKVFLFARDYLEMREANRLLKSAKLDLSLFGACPILGAYLISCSDTSAVINMAVADYGKAGWNFNVEEMKRKADPVIEKAGEFVRESRYEIVELRGMKGTVQSSKGLTNKPAALQQRLAKAIG